MVIKQMRNWKIVGSVQSGEDRSIRSNLSREEIPFQSFRQSLKNKSQHRSLGKDRSFCIDYFQKRKEDKRNLSYQYALSENENKYGKNERQDMFTSMRNVMKEDHSQSRVTQKNTQQQDDELKYGKKDKKNLKQAISRLESLKREQKKLKKSLQVEFNGLKNLFYQFQEVTYAYAREQDRSQKAAAKEVISYDNQFLKQIMMEAVGVQRYFAEMDRKKAVLMNRLNEG